MKDINLFAVAKERVSMHVAGPSSEITKIIKDKFGLDPLDPRVAKDDNLGKQIVNLIETARNKSLQFFPVKSNLNFNDPVNEGRSFQTNEKHPLDQAFEMLQDALSASSKTARRRSSIPMDPVENYLNLHATSSSFQNSAEYNEAFALINSIFRMDCPSGRSHLHLDPVDEFVAANFGAAGFKAEPAYNLLQWTSLLKEITGFDPEAEIIARSEDPVNDIAADQFGFERPSARAIKLLESRIISATNQLTHHLTPGSITYNAKVTELKQLEQARDKRIENLRVANGETQNYFGRTARSENSNQTKTETKMTNSTPIKKSESTKDLEHYDGVAGLSEGKKYKLVEKAIEDFTKKIDFEIKHVRRRLFGYATVTQKNEKSQQ